MTDFDSIWRFRDCIVRVLEQFSEKYAFCRQAEEHSNILEKKQAPRFPRAACLCFDSCPCCRLATNQNNQKRSKQAGEQASRTGQLRKDTEFVAKCRIVNY